ncbi:MAG: helix-turn-helix transcriptional regulator [Methylorubrum populi]
MPKREPFQRLTDLRRQSGYASASDAARAFGWNENTYRSHENGERGIRRDVAFKYAQAFTTTANYILFGESPSNHYERKFSNNIPLVGNVEGTDKVYYFSDYFDRHIVEIFAYTNLEVSDEFICFSVSESTSIAGIIPGSLIVTLKDKSDIEESNGKFCLIYTSESNHSSYLARISPADDNRVIVITPTGELRRICPAMILQVIFIVPPGQWHAQERVK